MHTGSEHSDEQWVETHCPRTVPLPQEVVEDWQSAATVVPWVLQSLVLVPTVARLISDAQGPAA